MTRDNRPGYIVLPVHIIIWRPWPALHCDHLRLVDDPVWPPSFTSAQRRTGDSSSWVSFLFERRCVGVCLFAGGVDNASARQREHFARMNLQQTHETLRHILSF